MEEEGGYSSKIVNLSDRRALSTGVSVEGNFGSTDGVLAYRTVDKDEDKKSGDIIPFERLYPLKNSVPLNLTTVRTLLNSAFSLCDDALAFHQKNELIHADECIQKVFVLLPEIFIFRTINEAIGYIALAVFHALQNQEGEPLNKDQIMSIRLALYRISEEPLMSFEKSVDIVENIENQNLRVESKEIEILSEAIGELSE